MSEIQSYDYLILGADAAGLSAAVQIRSNRKEATIGILDKGEIISYGACGLPYAIEGEVADFQNLVHFTPEKFSGKYRSDIFTSTEAVGVDPSSRTVRALAAGEEKEFRYGKLLIATGAAPVRLPLFDYSSPRIFELKTIPDGLKIKEALERFQGREIVIVGAGYIGLEMADVLVNLGYRTTVVEMASRPVPRMAESIGKAITKKMEEKGIRFLGDTQLQEVEETAEGVTLRTSAGEISASIVIVGTGVRPATQFLEGSGIPLDRGAVIINQKGETYVEDVYAAGDCALAYHILLKKNVYMPLGSTANKQGRIAGMNMAGLSITFPGILGTQIFKFFDLTVASTGLTQEQAKEAGYDPVSVSALRSSRAGYYPGGGMADVHLIVDKKSEKILGGHMVAPHHAAQMIDALAVMAQTGMKAGEAAYFDAAYAPPFAPVWNALISAAGKFGR